MEKNKFYITTTTPYVNADPHIGFALEIVAADVLARYQALSGRKVIFNTGTDEHGLKIYSEALKEGLDPKKYTDKYSARFKGLKNLLNLSYTNFIRTTDSHHKKAAQEFWKRCDKNGDIYKKLYKIKYCVGCELEITASELKEGRCPLHPNRDLEIIEEENYFFRFSKYQKPLLKLYADRPDFVKPAVKHNEIVSFVKRGLKDFSISRVKLKMPWGVPVPGDDSQVMYVWFDALVNYISTLGWPEDENIFNKFWPGVQIAGKDNLRQQSAMWQAMLMSAGLPNSEQILINGFISVDGQKMSKSLGNVISPKQLVDKYGIDAARYLIIGLGPIHTDMDVSWEKFDITYNADLANGLGNLVARVAKLCETTNLHVEPPEKYKLHEFVKESLDNYRFDFALQSIWEEIRGRDKQIELKKPWENPEKKLHILVDLVESIREIAYNLKPFMPETAKKILKQFNGPKVKSTSPLFPRL